MKVCEECGAPNAKICKAHDIRLCSDCMKLDEYCMICKTEAKKTYYLTDKDLVNVECTEVANSVYRNSMLCLYNKREIINEFCLKHSIDQYDDDAIENKLEELADAKKNAALKREENAMKRRLNRKKKLIKELELYGLELRSDSKLCKSYIDGTAKEWTLEEIITRMCEMKFLYEYCKMDKCYKEAERRQCEELNAGYIPDVPVEVDAEWIALKKYTKNGKYPKKWPWLVY